MTAFLTCALMAGSAAPAMAEGVGAGTLVVNRAEASYSTAAGPQSAVSNAVQFTVNEVLDVAAAPIDAGPISATPGSATLTFELTNIGNGPEAFVLGANPAVAGNDFDVAVESIAVDSNANGLFDAGIDHVLAPSGQTAPILADGALTIFLNVAVPAGASDAQTSSVELRAEAATGSGSPGTVFAGAGEGGGDAVIGVNAAAAITAGAIILSSTNVNLAKTVSVQDPFGGTLAMTGSVFTYVITPQVSGSASADGFVITDSIPAGTAYRPGTLRLDGALLSDASGDDAGEANAQAIAVELGSIAAGDSHEVSFEVVVQ